METLKLNARLATKEPVVAVAPTLPVGVYQVQLVVQGGSGKSASATLLIRVIKE
jgi:hypothetical protein